MSILGTLEGALGGANANAPMPGLNFGSGAAGQVATQIISYIQSRPGGLAGLLESFQQGGLGHVFQSWIGQGQNLPITPAQLQGTLGPEVLARITQATGLSQGDVEQHLSALLPQVIDHLTPNGQLPQGDLGNELAGLAQRLLHS